MNIAYTWSNYRSTCAICSQEIRRHDGIGIPVDAPETVRLGDSNARWSHSRCITAWEEVRRGERAAHARAGYARRKGVAVEVEVAKRPSKASVRYEKRRSKKSSPKVKTNETASQPESTDRMPTGSGPLSGYARREERIKTVLDDVCSLGVRIDTHLMADLLERPDCSDTVKSTHRALVGDRVFPAFSVSDLTGRVSFRQPNLGSLAKSESSQERALVLPDNGHVLFSVDMAQIEARLVAALCQDPEYMRRFDDGRDVHADFAELLLDDRGRREEAKRLVHGINYGMGKRRLSETAGIAVFEAEYFVESMARTFPVWAAWIQETIAKGRSQGQLTTHLGRVVPIERAKANTQAVARLVQATARDIFFESLLMMDAVGLTDYVRLVLHDEVVLSVPSGHFDEISRDTQRCLTRSWRPPSGASWVHLPATVSMPGETWLEASKSSLSGVS